MAQTKILITGATGFIGRTLVARFAARAADVALRLPVRDRARAEKLGLPSAALFETALTDTGRVRQAATDVDVVIHLAGAVRARRAADLESANVDVLAHVLAAVPTAARVILVSSLAAAGPSTDGLGSDAPPDACRPCSRYGDSKRRGELVLMAEAARSGRRWLVLRPCLVYGPGDGATALLVRQACGPLCPVPWSPRPLSTIDVRDVCAAIEATLLRPDVHGLHLPVAGATTDTHALMRALAASRDRRARLLPLPDAVVVVAGAVASGVARLRRRACYFSRDKAREIIAAGWVADREPAQLALGFRAGIALGEGLVAATGGRGADGSGGQGGDGAGGPGAGGAR